MNNFICLYHKICNLLRNYINRRRLINKNCSIISSNCAGGFISHYLHLRFNSPTVNLYILPKDFNTMLESFDYYFSSTTVINECLDSSHDFPVGEFETGVRIYFMHYKKFDEALAKWRERCNRIDKNNLYVILVERDECTKNDLLRFNGLPFKNKVALTHSEYNISSAYKISGFEDEEYVGHLHFVKNKFTGKRYIDEFDYVKFLNS